jgi:hypothetical protein
MRIGHQAPPIFVNVRTDAKLPRRLRADSERSFSGSTQPNVVGDLAVVSGFDGAR